MIMKSSTTPRGLRMTTGGYGRLSGCPPRSGEGSLDPIHEDIAASIQKVTEHVMLRMAGHLQRPAGQKRLCMAGGVALNCVANGRILREVPFEEIFIQPAAGDAGGAVGVAAFIHHSLLGYP